ncbi:MAG: lipoyl synthase [Planctomycetes bacterium]|nr:lipoyl synthase [Planctomycetota bacterium]
MTPLPVLSTPPPSTRRAALPRLVAEATAASQGSRPAGRRLPPWLKRPLPAAGMAFTRRVVGASRVATVCEEARCPNLTECWSHRTATFMILGDRCTRRCRFCAVETARPDPPAADEPGRLAAAVAELDLRHVVITAVARDDLADEGAAHFAACVRAVRGLMPEATIEVLPADFHARYECIAALCDADPNVYNHNIETVERLSPAVRPQARYRRSLEVLRIVKELRPDLPTKSGLMVGLGETLDEVRRTLADLREVSCDVVTIGQYLAPGPRHAPVARYYPPEEFESLADEARSLGFAGVASGPFVRSSYNAGDVYARYRVRTSTTTTMTD